jgi:hypothetical protein
MFEKIVIIFDAFKKAQAHIPLVFLCLLVRFFGTSFAQIFYIPWSECSGRFGDSNSITADRSDCEMSIRPH